MTAIARPRTLEQWLRYQQSAHPSSIDLTLDRVRAVAARLGLLRPDCPVAIVGGTNGKGSTATMLAGFLQACGRRVGLFTSPHLVRYEERIRLDGDCVGEASLLEAFDRVESARGAITLTFFEYSTLAALEVFRQARVQAMVLEVGLGGRLDATNIIDAQVAVLCSVGLDHRDWLGDSVELIGAEKAGIFRAGRPVVLGDAQMPVSVWRRLEALRCEVWCAQRDFHWRVRGGSGYAFEPWDYRSTRCELADLPAPALPGAIQYANAATALTALQLLGVGGACEAARVGPVLKALQLPGRFQIIPGESEWILDVAHNEPAARVLAAALQARQGSGHRGRTLAVAGMLADKDTTAITAVLDPLIDQWLFAGLQEEPRGLSAEALASRVAPLRSTPRLFDSVAAACEAARALAVRGDRIVVLGSFHVVGPALSWLGLY